MPQYKLRQYGLKQYGRYPEDTTSHKSRFQFLRARMGARMKDGTLVWVYQHRPVSVSGDPKRLRLRSPNGEEILLDSVSLDGDHNRIRIRANFGAYLESRQLTLKGSESP